jgi:hypothetical protein
MLDVCSALQLVCAEFAPFLFIRFEANLSDYGSYSLHICVFQYSSQTPFIHIIRLIFASKCPYKSACKNSFSYTGDFCFKKFDFKQIFEKFEVNFTFKRIFTSKYSHTIEFLLAKIRILANIRYVLL